MGTGLRDVVKGLMGVLDLTVPAQGTELWKASGGGENAPGWVNPDQPLFLHSIGAVCFCFSQQAESHRKSRQPDQETTEADSFHLSWFRTVILHLHQLWSRQASTDCRLKLVLSRGWLSINLGSFKSNTAVVKRGHSDVTKWSSCCKGGGIWGRTCGRKGSWGRRWSTHFEGCPMDCLLLGKQASYYR